MNCRTDMVDIYRGTGKTCCNSNGQKGLIQKPSIGKTKRNIARPQRLVDAQLLLDLADGFEVIHYPIPDFGVPEHSSLDATRDQVIRRAQDGKNIAIHCSAGIGRTGLLMAELAKKVMMMDGDSALNWVRLYIPDAVETAEQQRFVVER